MNGESNNRTLSEAIYATEKALNITSKELSIKLGMPNEILKDIKNGIMVYPQFETVLWIALVKVTEESLNIRTTVDSLQSTVERMVGATALWDKKMQRFIKR